MAREAKYKRDWKPTTIEAVRDACRFYLHTAKIMSNEKVFRPDRDFRFSTMIRINELALDIFSKCYEANEINATRNPECAGERLALQRHALADAKLMGCLIELARAQFHLPTPKVWNWAVMLHDLHGKIAAWHKSDRARYGKDEGLSNQGGCRLNPLRSQPAPAVC